MSRKIFVPFLSVMVVLFAGVLWANTFTAQVDTVKKKPVKKLPNYYEHVDVKVVYAWKEDKPEWYRNVCCQLIKEKGKLTAVKIFRKTCTDEIRLQPGWVRVEVRDHQSRKLIARGP